MITAGVRHTRRVTTHPAVTAVCATPGIELRAHCASVSTSCYAAVLTGRITGPAVRPSVRSFVCPLRRVPKSRTKWRIRKKTN